MRKLVLVAVAAVVVSGAATYGVAVYPNQRFRSALDQEISRLPDGFTASYKDATYSLVSKRAVVTGLTLHGISRGPQPQDLDVVIGEVDLVRPDLEVAAKWSMAAANPAAIAPDAVLPLADSITVKEYNFRLATLSGGAALFRVAKPRLYPWALLHDGVPSLAQAQAAMLTSAQPPQLEQMLPLLKVEAAIMLGIGYDGYRTSNLKLTGTVQPTPSTPATEISVTFRRIFVAADRGVIREAVAEAIAMDMGELGGFKLDRLVATGIDVQKPMIELLSGAAPSPALLDGLTIGRIEYGGMTMRPPGAAVPFSLGTFSLDNVGFSHGMLVSGAISLQGIRVERAQMPTPAAEDFFDKLGLDSVTMSFAVACDWNRERKRFTLHDMVARVDELGAITLAAEIADVSEGTTSPDAAHLARASLRFEDASLIDRWLRMTAAQAHVEPAAWRRQLIANLPQLAAILGTDDPSVPVIAKSIADFLTTPRSLTVELVPPAPLALATLQQASAIPLASLLAKLGLTVTANQ